MTPNGRFSTPLNASGTRPTSMRAIWRLARRSEEHTSELQSRFDLVCRLLLEKKKGGAGPLHACALADAMVMTTVIVPAAAGVLSAVGLLISPRHPELIRTWPVGDDVRVLEAA